MRTKCGNVQCGNVGMWECKNAGLAARGIQPEVPQFPYSHVPTFLVILRVYLARHWPGCGAGAGALAGGAAPPGGMAPPGGARNPGRLNSWPSAMC